MIGQSNKGLHKELRLVLELDRYPILCDEIRDRMRDEMFRRGVVRPENFEADVRLKAKASQRREGMDPAEGNEVAEIWEKRLRRVRATLTDFYFVHNLPYAAFRSIVLGVLGTGDQDKLLPAFNAEMAPLEVLFSRGAQLEHEVQTSPGHVEHHLQEVISVLTRSMLSDRLGFVGLARRYLKVVDLKEIARRRIGPGKVGGKAAGLALAWSMLQAPSKSDDLDLKRHVSVPESWYIGADSHYEFVEANAFYDVINQKYKDLEQIRADYDSVRARYLASHVPHDLVRRLEKILDRVGNAPLVVRSSSVLEDSFGCAFAGKYETHFCANQGNRQARLEQLCTAIRNVYASVVNPNAIAYRKQRGLIDYDERLAILIQKVQGRRFYRRFFPDAAGVAFSRNPWRWTQAIDRQAGMLRMVWGLGTRAVERVGQDHPRMVALSHPTLRPECDAHSITRYSQHCMDAIDLATNALTTSKVSEVIRSDYPRLSWVASVSEGDHITPIHLRDARIPADRYVITFDRLLQNEHFVAVISAILRRLELAYEAPVDIEFAMDLRPGPNLDFRVHLLQCRPNSQSPARVLPDRTTIPPDSVVFASSRTVTSGHVRQIRYVIYVDPERYVRVQTLQDRVALARLVGRLNDKLASDPFVLIGPGRWGSSNPELGVPVSYADIFNARALIEIPLPDEEPEASFGTHFFQDLVESNIYPVAVVPGNGGDHFNFDFFQTAPDSTSEVLGEHFPPDSPLKLIDIPKATEGKRMELIMNDEDDKADRAIAFLKAPDRALRPPTN